MHLSFRFRFASGAATAFPARCERCSADGFGGSLATDSAALRPLLAEEFQNFPR
jgi:hypothetical protein